MEEAASIRHEIRLETGADSDGHTDVGFRSEVASSQNY